MALCRFFKKEVPDIPSPYGPLSSSLSLATIKDANVAVKQCADRGSEAAAKPRGLYVKFTPEDQPAIAKYALWHGNKAAIHHFSKELGKEIKDRSVCTWKEKYSAELKRTASKRDSEGKREVCMKSLPVKKRGRPLLLGENLKTAVKNYIKAVREAGGVINTSITIAATTAIVRKSDRSLLSENGGPITITTNWAKSLLY